MTPATPTTALPTNLPRSPAATMTTSARKTPPPVRFERFEEAFDRRLLADGFEPVSNRFPLAGNELGMLGFRAVVRAAAGRSYVVAVTKGDALVQEQLRYLSDQYYNALVRETNELKQRPGLLRGVCIFAYERTADPKVAGFLMQRVRPRTPFAVIRSFPWVLDLSTGAIQRPALTRAPFPVRVIADCIAEARKV